MDPVATARGSDTMRGAPCRSPLLTFQFVPQKLEDQLYGHLYVAAISRERTTADRCAARATRRNIAAALDVQRRRVHVKICVIKEIVELAAELQAVFFMQLDRLVEAKIEIPKTRAPKRI